MDSMSAHDAKLFDRLVMIAIGAADGHLTILKFTGNWRVGFYTPLDRDGVHALAEGPTFAAAAEAAIDRLQTYPVELLAHYRGI